MTKKAFIILSSLLILLSACDKSRIYEKNIELPNKVWLADSLSQFEFEIKDTTNNYNLYYNIRNSISYPFQNIYVNYVLRDSTGADLKTDLVNHDLFDPQTGKPYGEGLGDVLDHQFLLLKDYNFGKPGIYKLTLQQFMRRDSLHEVLSVGIRVEKAPLENSN